MMQTELHHLKLNKTYHTIRRSLKTYQHKLKIGEPFFFTSSIFAQNLDSFVISISASLEIQE